MHPIKGHKNCWVFKHDDGHRLYGWICNRNKSNPNFQMCVLVSYDHKKSDEMDEEEPKRVERLSSTIETLEWPEGLEEICDG